MHIPNLSSIYQILVNILLYVPMFDNDNKTYPFVPYMHN